MTFHIYYIYLYDITNDLFIFISQYLQLIATEIHPGTGETFSSTSLVTVNIQDVNDNIPLFTQGKLTFRTFSYLPY